MIDKDFGPAHRPRRWIWVFGAGFLLASLLCGGGGAFALARHRAGEPRMTSLLMVQPEASAGLDAPGRAEDLGESLQTVAALIASPNVLRAAAADLAPRKVAAMAAEADPGAWLARVVVVRTLPQTRLIEVSAPDVRAADRAVVVDAVVDAFLRADRDWGAGERKAAMHRAARALEEYRAGLAEKRKALRVAEADGAVAEQVGALRDAIEVAEEMTRKLGVSVAVQRFQAEGGDRVRLVAKAGR